jgi:hypothetical protein
MVVAMPAADDYCEFCDLPLSQCVHGQPPPAPEPVSKSTSKSTSKSPAKAPPKSRSRPTPRARASTAPEQPPATLRWTPPEVFKPLILAVLEEAGGELDADELFLELEIMAEGRLRPGDRETTPMGELRWQYAARRARLALVDEGLMTKGKPGVWQLSRPGDRPR